MSTIKLKTGSGAPTAADLVQGEPALDLTNKRLYTEDASGSIIEVGTNPGVDVTFADGRKALFGAGSDLQLYHSGTHSYIIDNGTGDLKIYGANIEIGNTSGVKNLFATSGGATALYFNNASKLATTNTGIDVTGTVSADGFTVDGDSSFTGSFEISGLSPKIFLSETDTTDLNTRLRSAAGSLQIQTVDDSDANPVTRFEINHSTGDISIPSGDLDVTGSVTADGLTVDGSLSKIKYNVASSNPHTHPTLQLSNENTTDGNVATLMLSADNANGVANSAYIYAQSETANQKGNLVFAREDGANTPVTSMKLSSNGDVSLYEDTGTTAKFHWDAADERLGIGTSSPQKPLHAYHATIDNVIRVESGDSRARIEIADGNTTVVPNIGVVGNDFTVDTNGSEAMRIDSSGNVGIGTDSPDELLHLSDTGGNAVLKFTRNDTTTTSGSSVGTIQFAHTDADDAGVAATIVGKATSAFGKVALLFSTGNPTTKTERMRLDAEGNLLVGTTDNTIETSSSGEGVNIYPNKISVSVSVIRI